MNDDALVQELRNTIEETALVDLLPYETNQVPDPKRLSPQERVEVERTLLQYELIDPDLDLGHTWYLTPKGRRVAERLVASRTSGPGRRAAVEKALMRFIQARRPDSLSDFLDEVVDGTPVDERELEETFEALEEYGLAKPGFKSFGGIHSPKLTPSGRAAADDPRDPIDFVRQGGIVNYDNRNHVENHGTIGVAAAGEHAKQTHNTFNPQPTTELTAILAELRQELTGIGDVPSAALGIIEELATELEVSQPDQTKLSALSAAFTGSIAAKFGEEAYQAVPGLIGRLGTAIASLG